ncbi:MAG: response regulator transcription factor [Prosthecobacter sp.]|nr:response regulator transcription factor [Prosthecobacter sp.]
MSTNSPIRVAVVEDDERVRVSLGMMLRTADDILCVGECGTAEEALKVLPTACANVVFVDLNLPGMNGIDCTRRLAALTPKPQIVMLTSAHDIDAIFSSLRAGACGYLLKPIRIQQLLAAARDAAAGGSPMTSEITRRVVDSIQRYGMPGTVPQNGMSYGLTEREKEILRHLGKGSLYKEIADALNISYSTVRTHVERIYGKLQVQSRSQAVAKAGLLDRG